MIKQLLYFYLHVAFKFYSLLNVLSTTFALKLIKPDFTVLPTTNWAIIAYKFNKMLWSRYMKWNTSVSGKIFYFRTFNFFLRYVFEKCCTYGFKKFLRFILGRVGMTSFLLPLYCLLSIQPFYTLIIFDAVHHLLRSFSTPTSIHLYYIIF